MHTLAAVAVTLIAFASTAVAECVDVNADPDECLTAIVHINDQHAVQSIAGRPWPSVRSLIGFIGAIRSWIIDRNRDLRYFDYSIVRRLAPSPELRP